MKRHTNLLPFRDVRAKVLDLVCVYVWRRQLDRRGEVKYNAILNAGLPSGLDSFAHVQNEVHI